MRDDRLLRITITLSGEKHVYSKLAMTAIGTKHTSTIQNTAEIRIANLDRRIRDTLLTEGTPYAQLRPPKNSILIEAGRQSTGYSQIFEGDITTTFLTQPPDIWLVMQAVTGQFQKYSEITMSAPATIKYSVLTQQIADRMALAYIFDAPEADITNFNFSGMLAKLFEPLATVSRQVDAYIDDDTLIVRPRDFKKSKRISDVNLNTGMIGIPRPIDVGASCTTLVNRDLKLGDDINLVSMIYPAINGIYQIYKLGFNLSNRDQPFYYHIESLRKSAKKTE